MEIAKNIKYVLFETSNPELFQTNFYFWFLLKATMSIYYGFNIYFLFSGFSMWSFWEYIYHRALMHGMKNTTYYHELHGYHHLTPTRPAFIPVFQYMLVAPLFYVTSYCVNPSHVFSYSVGHMCGLYCFEKMHSIIHNDIKQEKIFTAYHMYHHKYSNCAFCFTTPCFDILCGTFPDKQFEYNWLGQLPIPYFSFYGITHRAVDKY